MSSWGKINVSSQTLFCVHPFLLLYNIYCDTETEDFFLNIFSKREETRLHSSSDTFADLSIITCTKPWGCVNCPQERLWEKSLYIDHECPNVVIQTWTYYAVTIAALGHQPWSVRIWRIAISSRDQQFEVTDRVLFDSFRFVCSKSTVIRVLLRRKSGYQS